MRRIWALVVALLVAANAQAISAPVPMPSPDSATFGVTVPAQAFFLRRLLGAGVKVEVLLPPGVNHETFEPSLGQLTRLQKAVVYFAVGHPHLTVEQAWLPRLRSLAPQVEVVDTTADSRALDPDEHSWLAFSGARAIIQSMTATLASRYPNRRSDIEKNSGSLLSEIDSLRTTMSAGFGEKPRTFLSYHPSWGYLAREFSLRQVVIQAEGKEAGLSTASKVLKQAGEFGLRVIIAEPSTPKQQLEYFCSALGARSVTIDPLGEDWFALVRAWSEAVRESSAEAVK